MKTTRISLSVLALLATSGAALAADVSHGEKLAGEWCSSCHLTGPDQTNSADAAPTLAAIATSAAERKDDLRAWLADPHPPMPNLNLTIHEIEDLLAYIESLRDD